MALEIETRALATGYPGHPVGRDMNLTIAGGRVTALLGPNGCGKTTLFRTLLGLLKPQGGRILIGGDDLAQLSRGEIAKRVAYVPQVVEGYFPFTVLDVVLMGRAPHLGMFAAPGPEDRRDEPTASLDFANQFHVLDCVRRLAGAGRTIVISSHHPDHALRFADRAVLMKAGGILADGPTAAVLTGTALSDVYGMAVRIAEVPAGGGASVRVCVPDPGAVTD